MRLTGTSVLHELRIQWRSLRFRLIAGIYLAAGSLPAVLTLLRHDEMPERIGAATYPAEIMAILPAATLLLGFLLALDGLVREWHPGSWSTLSVAPFSSAGWVLRRFLSLWLVVATLGAIPLLFGALLALRGGSTVEVLPFLVPWAVRILPIASLGTASGLLLGAVGDGALSGIALGLLVLFFGGVIVEETVGRWGLDHGLSEDWMGLSGVEYFAGRLIEALQGRIPRNPWSPGMPSPASEAPFDLEIIVREQMIYVLPCLALAALALALAPRFLRRIQPDRRPWKVGDDHPLRSFVALAAKIRDRYGPGPRPAPQSRWIALGLVLAASAGYGVLSLRALELRELGRVRYRAEADARPVPTPEEIAPRSWRVQGTLEGRTLDLEVRTELENRGVEPLSDLAFQLDPDMTIRSLTGPGGLRWSREWDRLAVHLERPLAPGESRNLRFRLAGRPARTSFDYPFRSLWTFHGSFGRYLSEGGIPFDLMHSRIRPLVSPTWTSLGSGTLFPRIRYTSWDLVESAARSRNGKVPDEVVDPTAELSLDLRIRGQELSLVDACGGGPTEVRLVSRCRIPLGTYLLAGGSRLRSGGEPKMLVFPAHREAVGPLQRQLVRAGARVDTAWPGAPSLAGLRVVEAPFEESWSRRLWGYRSSVEEAFDLRGRLLVLEEGAFSRREPPGTDVVGAALLGAWLAQRRAPVPEESFLQRWFFRALARRHLAPADGGTATLPKARGGRGVYAVDLFAMTPWSIRGPGSIRLPGSTRLESLLAHLEARVGPTALREAIELFVSRPGSGGIEELFRILAEERGEAWIVDFYRKFFEGTAVPDLVLDQVSFRREGGRWVVTGRVVNRGEGSQLCPVTLTTEIAPVTTRIEAPSAGSVPFRLASPYRPQAVFLDPEETCVRYDTPTTRDRVDFEDSSDA